MAIHELTSASATMFVAAAVLLLVPAHCMLDIRHFATGRVALPEFVDPGIQPPSFILALDQNKPPYDLSADMMEPFPGCSAQYASLCAVQHSIQLVTRVREEACPKIVSGGATREAALLDITNNAFQIENTIGFGVFVLDPNGYILADSLRPDLVGQRFDGFANSGYIAQASLLDYISWVVKWDGGFVPHFTTRLAGTTLDLENGEAPERASAYMEACSSGERIGVAFSRSPMPSIPVCDSSRNGFCAMQNVRRIVGRCIVDVLNTHSFDAMNEIQYKVSYGEDYSVGSFYIFNMHLSWWGYPGEHRWRNEAPLPDSDGTYWAIGSVYAKSSCGTNLSTWISGEVEGIPTGDYVQHQVNKAAWAGGAWQDYLFWSPVFDWFQKVALAVGYMWNGTAFLLGSGLTHLPMDASLAPACVECPHDQTFPCAFENIKKLSSHVEVDIATPDSNWSRISQNKWFGSVWPDAVGDEYEGTWPEGFYISVFDFDEGKCVANTESRDNIGKDASTMLGSGMHEKCKALASLGGGWVEYLDSSDPSVTRMAQVTMLAKSRKSYYMVASFSLQAPVWEDDCSSAYSEPCVEHNSEVLVGQAMSGILRATDRMALESQVKTITSKSGAYEESIRGDFRAYVLTTGLECHDYASGCPSLASSWITTLTSVSLEEGGWFDLEETSTLDAHHAFIKKVIWLSHEEVDVEELIVLVLVGSDIGPPVCDPDATTSSCPENSECSVESRRCECSSGYRANYTELPGCGEMLPTALTCVNVQNQKCNGLDCDACPAGYYCPYGEALPCARGFFCPGDGTLSVCPPGTMGTTALATNNSTCVPCAAGTYASDSGTVTCTPCEVGKYSKEGASSCEFCALGQYAPETGMSACSSCPGEIYTTRAIASESISQCVCGLGSYIADSSTTPVTCTACPAHSNTTSIGSEEGSSCRCEVGMYMSEDHSACLLCPKGSSTNGDGKVGIENCLCEKGEYMPLDASMCLECPLGMTCPKGSNEANTGFLTVAEPTETQVFPHVDEKYWASSDEPMSVFECRSEERCPGGLPGQACAAGLEGQACEHCQETYYWDGTQCSRCSAAEATKLVYPVLPVVFIGPVMLLLYKFFGDEYHRWGSFQNAITAVAFITLNHYQVISILGEANVDLPVTVKDVYHSYTFTTDASSLFKVECTGMSDFKNSMLLKGIAPLIFLVMAILLWSLSRLINRFLSSVPILETNRLLNVLGSLLFTFFSAIAALSLVLFKCQDNPNGKTSLASDLSVVCFDSGTWKSMLGLGICFVIVYIFGLGAIFIRAVIIAPKAFPFPEFQMRYKFLFIKFRAEAFWWALVFLAKNFLINLSMCIATAGVSQLYLVMTVTVFYMGGCIIYFPYRSRFANMIEVLTAISIIYASSLLTWFASREDTSLDTQIGWTTALLSFSPLAAATGGMLYLWRFGVRLPHTPAERKKMHEAFQEVSLVTAALARIPPEAGTEMMLRLQEWDCWYLMKGIQTARIEVLGGESAWRIGDKSISSDIASAMSSNLSPQSKEATEHRLSTLVLV